MAKQDGTIKITGTVSNVCFYKLDDKYYARSKSSLTGKRVKKDAAFKETMKYAGWLAKASVIASAVYRSLPQKNKGRKIYQRLTGKAIKMLKEELTEKEISSRLKNYMRN